MRLTSILVENFQALVQADVTFGPGLNVLYGPNDFGKSTLAQAIRAALLVTPTSSSMSEPFQPWYADAVPWVTLSFEDDDGQFWRVKKGFETTARSGSAELYHSKDGLTFTHDAKGRQVEERLRAILGWGIAAPGGKGSPRGLPESFLARTLLAAQTDVDRILGQSITEDATDTGKIRLSNALATLAQNPLFKKVLDDVQQEVDVYFTSKGQRKRGQGSRFVEIAQRVKDYEGKLAAARQVEQEATASAHRVALLRTLQAERLNAETAAQAAMNEARHRLRRWRGRDDADAKLRAARDAVSRIEARAADVVLAADAVERLSGALRSANDALVGATAEVASADAALRAAEEAYRVATSDDGTRVRALALAELRAEHAETSSRIHEAEGRRARLNDAVTGRKRDEEARQSVARARGELKKATSDEARAKREVLDLEKSVDLARKVVAYGHWKVASEAVTASSAAVARAVESRDQARAKEQAADASATAALLKEAELERVAATLTTSERIKELILLEREVERTEAALGGGLSVVLRPRKPIAVRAMADQSVALDEPALERVLAVEAERTLRLTLGDLLDVDITAGAPEKRRDLATLRARWEAQAVPVLSASGFQDLSSLERALERVTLERAHIAASRRDVDALRAQATELRARAALHDELGGKWAAAKAELEAREAALLGSDLALLDLRFAKLGKAWERAATALTTQAEDALAQGRVGAAIGKNECVAAADRVKDAEERAVAAAEAASALAKPFGTVSLESVADGIGRELATLLRRQRDLAESMAAHDAEATEVAQRAAEGVEGARNRVATAKESLSKAAVRRDEVLADYSGRVGRHEELKAQLETLDRSGAAQKVKECEDALLAFASDVATGEADVESAEATFEGARRALADVRSELHHAEGGLSRIGGLQAAEEVLRLQDAIDCAHARWQDLEIDADAHKLLLETLREVENAEGAHLGRALSGPVTARFRELTDGRYGALTMTPALRTEGVRPAGAGDRYVLEALSVGTREQLATLIRLAIAEQLKSAIVLDDQLVQTDSKRFAWFRDVLRRTCLHTQVIVLTCRPEDYLRPDELPNEAPVRDLAGGTIRVIDFARLAKRWTSLPSKPPPQGMVELNAR